MTLTFGAPEQFAARGVSLSPRKVTRQRLMLVAVGRDVRPNLVLWVISKFEVAGPRSDPDLPDQGLFARGATLRGSVARCGGGKIAARAAGTKLRRCTPKIFNFWLGEKWLANISGVANKGRRKGCRGG
jgi:hypothetical protein